MTLTETNQVRNEVRSSASPDINKSFSILDNISSLDTRSADILLKNAIKDNNQDVINFFNAVASDIKGGTIKNDYGMYDLWKKTRDYKVEIKRDGKVVEVISMEYAGKEVYNAYNDYVNKIESLDSNLVQNHRATSYYTKLQDAYGFGKVPDAIKERYKKRDIKAGLERARRIEQEQQKKFKESQHRTDLGLIHRNAK